MGVTHWDDREVHGLQGLFPLQNLLRKLRAGISALPEIEEPIRAELFSSERFELSLYKLNGFRAAFADMTLWNIL